MRVLIVEDDAALLESLRSGLLEHGMRVETAQSFDAGDEAASIGTFDVIVLDVLLPGGLGFDLCRRFRDRGDITPVLFLTAYGTLDDRLDGFDSGGDDYLVKPFSIRELLARLRALSRRSAKLQRPVQQVADLVVDLDAQTVHRNGERIALTAQEWSLLEFFVQHRGKVVSRAAITSYVWDDNHDPFSNLLEVLIWRLRRKLDDGREPKLLHTVRGAGYRFGQ
jgi:DNA-binding response OmpR family regulator